MSWQHIRTFNLNTIVKYSNVHIIIQTIISMQDSICNNFMDCYWRVLNFFQPTHTHYGYPFSYSRNF